jgi:hypothetical protein
MRLKESSTTGHVTVHGRAASAMITTDLLGCRLGESLRRYAHVVADSERIGGDHAALPGPGLRGAADA